MTHSTTLLLLTPRLHANHLNLKPVSQNLSTEQSEQSKQITQAQCFLAWRCLFQNVARCIFRKVLIYRYEV